MPGIRLYTAAVIRALAFGTDDVPADSNVFRFLSPVHWPHGRAQNKGFQ